MDLPALREARMKAIFRNLSLGETQKQKQENSAVRKDSVRNQPIQKESAQRKQPIQRGSVPENVYIAIMGLTGVGKSTFISRLVGSKVAIGHDLESCTQEIGVYSFQYNKTTKVHLIDTPGFDDTNRTDFHVLEEIASFLSRSYKNDLRINGIIYLHRISDNRMQGSSMTSIRMFRKLVGTDFYPRVVLATTMWESVKHDDGIKREAELISDSKFWGYMKERGCKIRRAMNTKDSAMDIVGIIVAQQSSFSKDSDVLAVQRELVDQGKDLIDTNVGREVENQFSETLKRQQDELAAAKEEVRLARQTQGLKARSLLIEQRRMISEELKRMTQIQENMRQEMQKELERREKRHQAEIQKLMQTNEKIRADIANAEKRKGAERITARIAPTSSMPSGLPADEYDLDSIIERLLEVRGSPPGKQVQLLEGEIRYLIEKARGIFLSQPMLLELKAPLKIVGDIKGQYYDLLRVFEYQGFPPEANYLFLGNYVDHGEQSLETICLCLAWKIKYPYNFFMLRGSHECAAASSVFGFYYECKQRYREDLWKRFTDVFNTLPLAAIIDGKIMCMSGGLSPDLNSMDQIKRIMRPTDVPDCGLIADLLWSKPDPGIHGWRKKDRGISFTFGPDVVERFCQKHGFDLVVRGSQCVEDGYEFFAKRQLVTLWTAPNYRGRWAQANAAGVLVLSEDLLISFAVLKPTETEGLPQRPDDKYSNADDEHPIAERNRYYDEYYGWRKGLRDSEQ